MILDVKVSICPIDDLRRMKRAAGRPRDSVDLEDLDAADWIERLPPKFAELSLHLASQGRYTQLPRMEMR